MVAGRVFTPFAAPEAGAEPSAEPVQRAAETGAAPQSQQPPQAQPSPQGWPSSFVVQREDYGGDTTPAPTPDPPPASSDSTSPTEQFDDGDLDELGKRLYPRILDHLKTEMSRDRERAGTYSDLSF